jgi:DNA-binding response OmpR family regulator
MSGRSDVLQDCELYGANDIIEKPFDIQDLLNKIDKLLLD